LIDYSEKDGALTFKVQVVPRAARSGIVGEHNNSLRVRLAAPPVEGAANEELVRLLARGFRVSRSEIEIMAGHTSKIKQVRVQGAAVAKLRELLGGTS
jgi:uncharacterized protein (TIGR00251 family)